MAKVVQEKSNMRIAVFVLIVFFLYVFLTLCSLYQNRKVERGCEIYGEDYMLVKSEHRADGNVVKGTEYFCCKNATTDCHLLDIGD